MHRNQLLEIIDIYEASWARGTLPYPNFDGNEEHAILARFRQMIQERPRCFENDCYEPGHITASALVVSPSFDQVLLTLHGKLNLWLQLGGHTDGHPQPHEAAMREAEEESGLSKLAFLAYEPLLALPRELAAALPFDFDVHLIPARKDTPEHSHFDVRYVIVADPTEPLVISEESQDLRWFTLDAARQITSERSMHRQFDKLAYLATRLAPKKYAAAGI